MAARIRKTETIKPVPMEAVYVAPPPPPATLDEAAYMDPATLDAYGCPTPVLASPESSEDVV